MQKTLLNKFRNKFSIAVSFIIIFCASFLLCGCEKSDTVILLNHRPITKDNFLDNSIMFKKDERIYYLFMTQKPLETDFIRVKVLKRDEKVNFEITKPSYSNDFRLYKDQVYYYNDYLVIHEAGYYCIEVSSRNKLNNPLARVDFQVKN